MTSLESGIDWGTQIAGTSPASSNIVHYFFVPGGQGYATDVGDFTTVDFTPYEKAQFLAAFAIYETFLNVSFVAAGSADTADIRIGAYSNPNSSYLAAFGPPFGNAVPNADNPDPGNGIFNVAGIGWDRTGASGTLEEGGYGFVTIIHELGHSMGLAHPHDNGGTSTIFPGVSGSSDTGSYGLNQGVYTTMSYNDGWKLDPDGLPPDGGPYGFQGTPMAIDIAVLQAKYGANLSYHNGDDAYLLPGSNGAGTFFSCIWDAGGTDQIDYNGTRAATIDLRAATLQVAPGGGGFISYVHGVLGGFTIAHGVTIENAASGFGADVIVGNGVGNILDGRGGGDRLFGGGGDDTLTGSAGADLLAGGPGNDLLFGGGAADAFLFNTALSAATNVDHIADFTPGLDVIELAPRVFTTLSAGALPAAEFYRGNGAHDPSDRIIYNPGNGSLIYDANGSHAGGGIPFAKLAAGLAVHADDFLVV